MVGEYDRVILTHEQVDKMIFHLAPNCLLNMTHLIESPSVEPLDVEISLDRGKTASLTFVKEESDIIGTFVRCYVWADEPITFVIRNVNGTLKVSTPVFDECAIKKITTETLMEYLRLYLKIFLVIQYLLLEPINVFSTTVRRTTTTSHTNRKRAKKRQSHKVIAYKVLTINEDEFEKLQRPKQPHEIQCPAWGVRGHYRHYKSGKTVFVRQYVKGKDKTKYQGKEYVLFPQREGVID